MRFSSIFTFKTAVILLTYLFEIVFNRARYTEWAGKSSQGKALNQISSPHSLFVPCGVVATKWPASKKLPSSISGGNYFSFSLLFLSFFFFLFVSLSLDIIDFYFFTKHKVSQIYKFSPLLPYFHFFLHHPVTQRATRVLQYTYVLYLNTRLSTCQESLH